VFLIARLPCNMNSNQPILLHSNFRLLTPSSNGKYTPSS
jgi:hypothetical protein